MPEWQRSRCRPRPGRSPRTTGPAALPGGIATGPALIGNIGSREVRNFTAIGDTTNLAARLQTLPNPVTS